MNDEVSLQNHHPAKAILPKSVGYLQQFLPLLFSGIAVIVSLSTLYLTQLKPAKIAIRPGETMQVWHNSAGELNIDMSVVFRNMGSQPQTINSLALILKNPNSDEALFMKYYGIKRLEPDKPGISLIYESLRFSPLTIPPREELTKFVDFYAGNPGKGWIPKPIKYDLYILAWTGGSDRPDHVEKVQWGFTDEDIRVIVNNLSNIGPVSSPGRLVNSRSYGGESRELSPLEFDNLVKN